MHRFALVLVLLAALFALPLRAAAPQPAQAAAPLPRIRWGYHVNFDSNSGLASLRQHIGRLTHLAPRWYTLDAQGALAPAPDPNRAAIIALARANGVKLIPYVRNTAKWNDLTPFFDSAAARARAVASIAAAVTAENFDGIHVDFEEVNPTDSSKLTQFIGELAAAMRQRGKLMSQAMGPKLNDAPTGWGASWDYAALGKLNDLVVVMAYTAPTTRPHPIAAAPWVEQNIAYALSKLPAEKIVLGLPWYGYDWNITRGDAGVAVTGPQALARAAASGVTPEWNAQEQEYTYGYAGNGEQHRVWYSDRRSFAVRLGMVAAHGLAGAAFWRVGQEEPGVWESLTASPPPSPTATATPLLPTPTATTAPPATATATPTPPVATATATATPAATATPLPTAAPAAPATGTATMPPAAPTAAATMTAPAATVTALPSDGGDGAAGDGDAPAPPGGWPIIALVLLSFVALGGGAGLWRLRRGHQPPPVTRP